MDRAEHNALVCRLIDEGRLIDGGWISFVYKAIPSDTPQARIDEMHDAFFAGAQHLFAGLMTIFESQSSVESSLERVNRISVELEKFLVELRKKRECRSFHITL